MSDQPFDKLLSDDDIDKIVRKVDKAHDQYAKLDVLSDFVDWGRRTELLWWLTAEERLEAWDDPYLWHELASAYPEHGSPEVVAELLTKIEEFDVYEQPSNNPYGGSNFHDIAPPPQQDPEPYFSPQRLVDYWPSVLDNLAIRAYADDPDAFMARFDDYPEDIQKGIRLVQRRFGDIDVDELPDGILEDLARNHVNENGLPSRVLMVDTDDEKRIASRDIGTYDGIPPAFYDFIDLHGPRERWNEAVLERSLAQEFNLEFNRTLDGWRVADDDQLATLLERISAYGRKAVAVVDFLVDELEKSPESLVELADTLADDDNLQSSEVCALATILRCKQEGRDVPESLEARLNFRTLTSPTQRGGYEMLEPIVEALEYLGLDRARACFLSSFDAEYYRTNAIPALKAFPEADDLFERAIDVFEEIATQKDDLNFAGTRSEGIGFAEVGPTALPRLEAAHDATDNPKLQDTYRRSAVYILAGMAEAGEELPDEHIDALSFTEWMPEFTDTYNFGHYLVDDIVTALKSVSYDRAEALLLEELDSDKPLWPRALAGVEVAPSGDVMLRVLSLASSEGVPGTKDNFNWFERMLRNLPDECLIDVGDALAKSDDAELHNAVRKVLGEDRYETMLEEAGGSSAADDSKADKVARLSAAYLEEHPDAESTTLFFLERLDDEPSDDSVTRIGGAPFGVDADDWPYRDDEGDEPFDHMFTVDLEDVPSLAAAFDDEARAVSLFIHSPDHNQAWSPGNDQSIVRISTDDEVAEGPFEGELPSGADRSARAVGVREIDVPSGIFDYDPSGFGDPLDEPLDEIRSAVYSTQCWGGGSPIWLQSPQPAMSRFLMQFDESFVWMNLGDMGIMYVFGDTAFWQCH